MRALLTLTAVFLLVATAARAQWERVDNLGLQAPHYGGLAAADEAYLYQTVLIGPPYQVAFFRSSDNGTTWTRSLTFPGTSIIPKFFNVVATNRLIMGSGDAAGENGVFLISDDRGDTWSEVKTTEGIDVRTAQWLIADIYVAGVAGKRPIRSTDAGVTWKPVTTGPIDMTQLRAMGRTAVAVTATGSVYRSTDAGESWEPVSIDPQTPTALNLATSLWIADGLFMVKRSAGPVFTSVAGATWSSRQGPIDDLIYTTVEASPDGRAWLLSGPNVLYLSTDGGKSAVDVSAGYPRENASTFCIGDFTLTNTAAHTAAVCNLAPGSTGMYRYQFSAPASAGERAATEAAASDLRAISSDGGWRIEFAVPSPAAVRITVHDNAARAVATILDGHYEAGSHAATYDASRLPAGIYWVTMESGGKSTTARMVEVR